ncbi:MAG: 3-dehydroquinate synthase [Candidatus Omnitrophota bacterium]
MKKIRVSLGDRSYDILIGHGIIKNAGAISRSLDIGKDAVIVTNKTLAGLYRKPLERSFAKAGITTRFELVPDSEKAKSLIVLTRLLQRIASYDKNRSIFIVAFGGGVIGDLAGFTAAIYKRGIPYIQIPTTLLAQVDSSIGGKTAIDLPVAKNLIGAFYQPRAVISDISITGSLSLRQVKNGLAEIIKYGVIKDPRLFSYLEKNYKKILSHNKKALEYAVLSSAAIKARTVEADEFDNKGRRVILNFGHTVGHAIEAASEYAGKYDHGEAVAIGMIAASRIGLELGLADSRDIGRIMCLIKAAGLPVAAKGVRLSRVYNSLLHDKKFAAGRNRFVLPVKIGHVKTVSGVPVDTVKKAIQEVIKKG